MKIINYGKKDYYDYLSGTWGEDPVIVYDRSNPTVIVPENSESFYSVYFYSKPLPNDTVKVRKSRWKIQSIAARVDLKEHLKVGGRYFNFIPNRKLNNYKEGKIYFLFVEIGDDKYTIEVERYLDDNDDSIVHVEPKIIHKETGGKISESPIAIYPGIGTGWGEVKADTSQIDRRIDNPIIWRTWLAKLFKPEDVWAKVYEYLGSLKDKPIVDSRSDDEHIESNGFDKITSFRKL